MGQLVHSKFFAPWRTPRFALLRARSNQSIPKVRETLLTGELRLYSWRPFPCARGPRSQMATPPQLDMATIRLAKEWTYVLDCTLFTPFSCPVTFKTMELAYAALRAGTLVTVAKIIPLNEVVEVAPNSHAWVVGWMQPPGMMGKVPVRVLGVPVVTAETVDECAALYVPKRVY